MKRLFFNSLLGFLFVAILLSCKKDPSVQQPQDINYTSLADFYSKNGVALQTYTINAATGGSFTTPQGTVVTIPTNAFVTQGNNSVSGTITIQFKDIYKKSDMLLSNMPTTYFTGIPLKSGGEFFIKAIASNDSVLILAPNKKIDITQPIPTGQQADTSMSAMVLKQDTIQPGLAKTWYPEPEDTVYSSADSYIFSLYTFSTPADSGTWNNSDNGVYFSTLSPTILTVIPSDTSTDYEMDIFLVFKTINCMVRSDYNIDKKYPFNAPLGFEGTVVVIGYKNGNLYSSFTPITISPNMTVNFTLSQTTTTAFKSQLSTLD